MEPSLSTPNAARFEALRRHRAELRESMSALENALAVAGRARWLQRVEAALTELSADFREHIDITEGSDGLYGDVVRSSPRLAGVVDGFTGEHAVIAGRVEALLTRVSAPDAAGNVDRVRDLGTALLGRFVRHPSAVPTSCSRPTRSTSAARPERG